MRLFPIFSLFLLFNLAVSFAQDAPQTTIAIVAEGLLNPIGLAALPDGSLFIAEEGTGKDDLSAGVSLLTPDGQLGRLISGLPSSRDSGDLSGVPLVAISPDERLLYVGNFAAGHLWTLPLRADAALSLPDEPYTPVQLGVAMQPLNRVALTNPFDLTFDLDGVPVVSDASENGIAKENPDGTTRFIHRFDPLINPQDDRLTVDPVPTGITRVGEEFYVTLTGGCPFPPGAGELVAIDENRNQRTVVDNLNMPIDVEQGADGSLWVLEFATFTPGESCFTGSGYEANTGRLSRIGLEGRLEPLVTGLNFPGAVLPLPDGSVYVSEVFSGRVLHITFTAPEMAHVASGSRDAAWRFRDVANEIGLDFQHGAFHNGLSEDPAAMMGGGLCWLDYDNDGWLDLYLVNSYAEAEVDFWQEQGGAPRNALFHNKRGVFSDVSAESGADLSMRGNGCVAGDFNRDGLTDLYVTADGPNALLWNNGDGTFTEGAAAAGIDAPEWNTAAAVGDLNADGWPDFYVASYIDLENKIARPVGAFPQDYFGIPDHIYLNNGPDSRGRATFRDVTLAAGILRDERALGAILSDLDDDGDLDLYIANDGQPNRLYENQPWPGGIADDPEHIGFRLVDLSDTADVGDAGSGMGVASADFDADGMFDLFVTNWESELNAMYRNQTAEAGLLNFRYSTYRIGMWGLGGNMTGWGTTWADFDHDTDVDLLVVNGRVPITNIESDPELVRLYGNRLAEGHPGEFREWTQQVGLDVVGPLLARGSAVADFDNDGDLDVAVNTIAGSAALLRNENPPGNWLQVEVVGFFPGTIVELALPDGRELRQEWHTGSSYLASEDPRLHFGLGAHGRVPELTIRWPDGRLQTLQNVAANQIVRVARPG